MAEYPELDKGRRSAPRFEPGNSLAVSHGGTVALWKLQPRVEVIAARLREGLPAQRGSDEATVLILAGLLARVESMQAYVEKNGVFDARGRVRPVMRILLSTETAALKAADSLGLNTRSRVALGLDAAQGSALTEYLKERYGAGGDE